MLTRNTIGALALATALSIAIAPARAHDEAKYPDWKGQWFRAVGAGGNWDPTKRPGLGQQAPLTPEYQALLETGLKEVAAGGHGNNPTPTCHPPGMPRSMIVYEGMELVVTADTTYVMLEFMSELRRIYTDGRDWPEAIKPSFSGYSIGRWVDENGDGRYDALEVETRGLQGPRTFDGAVPMHEDNQTVVKERIYLDPANPDLLRNDVTTMDHALTRPWTVTRSYRRERNPIWFEYYCSENNQHVFIGKDNYLLSADGNLMPARKDQPPPDLRYFNATRK